MLQEIALQSYLDAYLPHRILCPPVYTHLRQEIKSFISFFLLACGKWYLLLRGDPQAMDATFKPTLGSRRDLISVH